MAVLEAQGLVREAAGRRILDRVGLHVASGDCVAVTGPSGSGKTSLLRLLVRLDEPQGGTVRLDGRDIREMDVRRLRRRVCLAVQEPTVFPGSLRENATVALRLRREAVDEEAVDGLLARLGLADVAHQDATSASTGQRQRMGLARALLNGPQVLLLDEPTASLDRVARQSVEELLRERLRDGLAVVLVSHDEDQAARVGDRVLRIDAGRMREEVAA